MEMENRLTGAAEVSAKRTALSVQRAKLRGFGPPWQSQNCGKFPFRAAGLSPKMKMWRFFGALGIHLKEVPQMFLRL
jgi:hypothetical protein